MHRLHAVAEKVLSALALALGLEEDTFVREMDPSVDDAGSALAMNYYPSLEGRDVPEETVRSGCFL